MITNSKARALPAPRNSTMNTGRRYKRSITTLLSAVTLLGWLYALSALGIQAS